MDAIIKDGLPYQPELDPIDWRTSLRRARNAIVRHVPLILGSVAVTLLLLVAYVRIFPPIYRADATVQAEPDTDGNRNEYYSLWNLFRKADMKSEPELVMSGRVAVRVVDSLGLTFNDVHHTMLTQIAYLWTESWVGKTYRRVKEWFFPPDPSMYKPTPAEIERARTIDAFRDGIKVEIVPGTSIARITVLAPSWRAAQIANKTVEVYLDERTRMFRNEADRAYNALKAEAVKAEAALANLDREKLEFDTRNRVVLDFEKDKLLVADWVKLQSSAADVRGTIAGLQASLAVVEKQLAAEPAEIVTAKTLQDSKLKTMLQQREFELATNLQQARERFVPDSPDIKILERALAEVRVELAKEPDKVTVQQQAILNPLYSELREREQTLKAQLASAQATLEAKRQPLGALERRMGEYPGMVKTITETGRVREGLEARYKLLRDRLMMADVSRTAVETAPASVRVIDLATPPMRQSWPKMVILLPSAIALGLFLGFGMALIAELFSSRVNRDRLSARPEYPVYAVINLRPMLHGQRVLALPEPGGALARLRGPG